MIFEIKEQHGIIPDSFIEAEIQDIVLTGVRDGDSMQNGKTQLRLIGINTPELKSPYCSLEQPMAREIADDVRYMYKGKTAIIRIVGKDVYQRTLCKLEVNGIDVSLHLLSKGYGHYMSTPIKEDRKEYIKIRDFAKRKKIGIWSLEPPCINPKKWREMYGISGK
jgi:endonuclease YncB( thermonuclease family)